MKELLENQEQQTDLSEKKNWMMPELSVIGKNGIKGGPVPSKFESGTYGPS